MSKELMLANAVQAFVGSSLHKSNTRPQLKPKAEAVVREILAYQLELTADEGDEGSDRGKLKVLNDGDGVRLLMSIYQDYVSDDDYVKFPDFMYNVDTLLYKARGNRALTREEREEMEESAPKRGKKGRRPKPRPVKPPAETGNDNNQSSTDNQGTTMAASDLGVVGAFFAEHLSKTAA